MKTSFLGKGKFKLVLFATLCTVVLGCAVFLCFNAFNKNDSSAENSAPAQTEISRPEPDAKKTAAYRNINDCNQEGFMVGPGEYGYEIEYNGTSIELDYYLSYEYELGAGSGQWDTDDLRYGTDYTITYSGDTVNPGTVKATITGIGNYSGSITQSYNIWTNISNCDITVSNCTYNGKAQKPVPTVKFNNKNVGYADCSYSNNINAGTASVTISGDMYYKGTVTKNFTISPINIGSLWNIELSRYSIPWGGTASSVDVYVTDDDGNSFTEGVDYTVSGNSAIKVGTHTVTVTAKGSNYTGTLQDSFTITLPIRDCDVTLSSVTYTGSPLTPKPNVVDNSGGGGTLKENTHYTLSYSNNTNVGTATVTITGKGCYTGTTTESFGIMPKPISDASFTIRVSNQTYTGSPLTPKPTVTCGSITLTEGTDYTLEYSNNINVGTATVKVLGVGNFGGYKEGTFRITQADLSLSLTYGTVVYGMDSVKPTLTGNLGNGTVRYSVATAVTNVAELNTSTGVLTIKYAGEITIDVVVSETKNYKQGTARTKVNILSKAIAVPTLAKGANVDSGATVNGLTATTTYNGKAQHFTLSSVSNITFNTNSNSPTRSGTDLYATNFGTYTLSLSIDRTKYCWGTTDGGTDTADKKLTITINKASLDLGLSYPTVTYGSNSSAPTVTGNSGNGTKKFTVEDGTGKATINSSTGVLSPTQAGDVTVTLSVGATDNYPAGTKTITVTIEQADNPVKITSTATSVVYGSTITMTGTGTGALSWKSSDTSIATVDASTGVVTPVKQGKVTISLTAAGNTNYKAGTATKEITVQRKAIAIPTLAKGSGVHSGATASNQTGTTTYNGGAQHFTISSTANITFGTPTTGATRSGTDFYATNAGTYTVSMTIDGNKYCWGSSNGGTDTAAKTLTITVNKAGITLGLSYGTVTFGSTASPTLTGNSGNGTAKYTVTNGTGKATIYASTGVLTPTQAGNVTVKVEVPATTNYAAGSKEITVTISPKDIATVSITAPADQTYTGSPLTPKPTVTDGNTTLVEGTDYTLSYPSDCTNVGPKTVTVTGTGNYGGSTTTSYKIEPTNGNVQITSTATTVVYGSTLTVTGSGYGTLSWLSSDTSVATIDSNGVLTPVKQGKVTITLTAAGDANHDSGTATVEITVLRKAIYVPSLATGAGAGGTVSGQTATTTYSGSAQHYTVSSTSNITFGTVTGLTLSGNDISVTDANTYVVSMQIDGDKYCWGLTDGGADVADKSLTITVNKASLSLSLSSVTVVYGATASATLTGNSGNGAVTWSSSDTTVATVSGGTVTPVKVGITTITAKIAESANCLGGTATATVTVQAKAIAIPTLATGSGVHGGATASNQTATTVYNGGAQHFTLSAAPATITFGTPTTGATLSGTDFYATNAGTYTVSISIDGDKYCWGSTDGGTDTADKTLTITINDVTLTLGLSYSNVTFGSTASPTLTGNSGNGTPKYTVTNGTGSATIDASTGVLTPTQAGNVTVKVEVPATANYAAGSLEITVTISPKDIATVSITAPADQTYTGGALTPKPTVTDGNTTLVEGTDYTLSYKDNINMGTATVTVTGQGNYTGTAATSFKIGVISIGGATITLATASYTFDGVAKQPAISSVTVGALTLTTADYTVAYTDNTNAGTATVTITGQGNYSGTASVTFTINAADLTGATITLGTALYTYDGKAQEPAISSVTVGTLLPTATDYTVAYSNNTNAGTATVTITGQGNYTGTATVNFTITAADISGATVTDINAAYVFTGSAIEPEPTVDLDGATLVKNTDYTVSYSANTAIGTATVTISGVNNYTGNITVNFEIKSVVLSGLTVDDSGAVKAYYALEAFDTSSVTVTADYSDGTQNTLTFGGNGYLVVYENGADSLQYGDTKVTFSFTDNGVTKTVEINGLTISKKPLDKPLVFTPEDTDYNYGNPVTDGIGLKDLPDWINVTYVYEDEGGNILDPSAVKNAGKYKVTAKFTVDKNHADIADITATFEVKKLNPVLNPSVGGSLSVGKSLSELTVVAGGEAPAGKLTWDNSAYRLQEGVNKCYYTFTPDDTVNFNVVHGFVEVTASGEIAPVVNGTGLGGWQIALIVVCLVVVAIALIALMVALKSRRAAVDADGFYDDASPEDMN